MTFRVIDDDVTTPSKDASVDLKESGSNEVSVVRKETANAMRGL